MPDGHPRAMPQVTAVDELFGTHRFVQHLHEPAPVLSCWFPPRLRLRSVAAVRAVVLVTLNTEPVRPWSRATTHQPSLPEQVIRQRNGADGEFTGMGTDMAGLAGIGSIRFG
jgi:hypothetical protein